MLELNEIWALSPVLPRRGRQKQEVSRLLKLEPGKVLPFQKLLIAFACRMMVFSSCGGGGAALETRCPVLLLWPLSLQSTGSRVRGLHSQQHTGSVTVVHA